MHRSRTGAALGRDIAIVLAFKLVVLMGLWFVFFAPSHHAPVDVARHLAGDPLPLISPANAKR